MAIYRKPFHIDANGPVRSLPIFPASQLYSTCISEDVLAGSRSVYPTPTTSNLHYVEALTPSRFSSLPLGSLSVHFYIEESSGIYRLL